MLRFPILFRSKRYVFEQHQCPLWNHTPIFCMGLFMARDGDLLNNFLGTIGYHGLRVFFFWIGGLREVILFVGPICLCIKQFEIIYQNYLNLIGLAGSYK